MPADFAACLQSMAGSSPSMVASVRKMRLPREESKAKKLRSIAAAGAGAAYTSQPPGSGDSGDR